MRAAKETTNISPTALRSLLNIHSWLIKQLREVVGHDSVACARVLASDVLLRQLKLPMPPPKMELNAFLVASKKK